MKKIGKKVMGASLLTMVLGGGVFTNHLIKGHESQTRIRNHEIAIEKIVEYEKSISALKEYDVFCEGINESCPGYVTCERVNQDIVDYQSRIDTKKEDLIPKAEYGDVSKDKMYHTGSGVLGMVIFGIGLIGFVHGRDRRKLEKYEEDNKE